MKKILFISDHSPFEFHSGGHQRTRLLCASLAEIGQVDVLSTEHDVECNINNCTKLDFSLKQETSKKKYKFFKLIKIFYLSIIPPLLVMPIYLFNALTINVLGNKDKYLTKIVKKLCKKNKYDFICVRYIRNIIKFGVTPNKKVILDIDDLPEQLYKSELNTRKSIYPFKSIFNKLYIFICSKTSHYYTKKITDNVLLSFLPNKSHCSLFNNTVYLPNIPFQNNMIKRKKSEMQIMFVGKLNHEPNYAGIEYFLENIYPLVLKSIPYVNFNIIGEIAGNRKYIWLEKYKKITILGFIYDINYEYERNHIIIAPIYQGSGTNIKVLEAMCFGKACVISQFAGKGFENILSDGKNIMIADNDIDFAEKIIRLIKDNDLRESIEKSAKEAVQNFCSFDYFAEIIKKSLSI